MEQCVFERMDNFLTKYGHASSVIFREWAFFWQNMGMRAVIVSWKICEKGILLSFCPIIYCSFDSIDVFWPNMGMTAGVLHEKDDMRALCFLENGSFLSKYGPESSVFFYG